MKKLLQRIILLLVIPFSVAFADTVQPLDKIVAVINSDVITQSALDRQMNMARQQMQSAGAPLPDAAKFRSQVLDDLIDQKLLLLLAQRNNLVASDAQVNKAVSDIAARNHMTLDQLQAALVKQGTTYKAFRDQIRDQMSMQSVQAHALGPVLAVSQQDVNNYLKQHPDTTDLYHVQDILIPIPATTPTSEQIAQAKQQATALLTQLQQNSSQSLPSGVQNNDLAWRSAKDLPDIFLKPIQGMKTGDIVGPIQAPNGFHLLKLVGTKSNGQPLTSDQARQIVYQQKLQANLKPFLAKMRATAYVKVMD